MPWRALGVAGAVLLSLALAALLLRARGLRADDLLFVALGIVAGGVIGGRLVHGLVFLPTYAADPGALLDPARGSFSLLGAVGGGALGGRYIVGRLEAPAGLWADIAAAPMLLAIGLGKLAQLLAGAGQGVPFDGTWALAFTSPGPWASVLANLPAHPAQAYEGLWALAGVPVMLVLLRRGHGTGRLLMMALAWWLLGRIAAASTWRDERLLGPLNVEQMLAVLLFAFAAALVVLPVPAEPTEEALPPADGDLSERGTAGTTERLDGSPALTSDEAVLDHPMRPGYREDPGPSPWGPTKGWP